MPRPTLVRYLVLVLLALAMACAYLTRVWGAFNTTIRDDLGIDANQMGTILAGFSVGYFIFQIPGGWLGARYGARTMLAAMSLLWSLAAVAATLARTERELYWARLAIGLAQGGLVPCTATVLAAWVPLTRRGVASSLMGASMQGGALLALGWSAQLLERFTWREILFGYSSAGIIWAVGFYLLYRNRPAEHPWTNEGERQLIRGPYSVPTAGTTPAQVRPTLRDWAAMLLRLSFWAMCIPSFCRGFGYAFLPNWLPAFLENAHGVPRAEAGQMTMLPVAMFAVGSITGGFVVDALLMRTGSKWLSRSGTAAVGLALAAACNVAAVGASEVSILLALIAAGSFLNGVAGPPSWAIVMDVGGRHSGIFMGILNMCANVGEAASAWGLGLLFRHIEKTGASWTLVLGLFVGVYLVGSVFWALFNPNRPLVRGADSPSS